jgi:LEA14-like dessication related protein
LIVTVHRSAELSECLDNMDGVTIARHLIAARRPITAQRLATARRLTTARSLLVCASLCLLLAGCALRPHLEPPQLSVSEVDILSSDFLHQRLRVRMHVQNPNNRVLAVKDLEYTLEVEGQQLASGSNAESFTVPALGETDFDMNVSTNLAGAVVALFSRGSDALNQGVAYHLTGKVTLSEGWIRSIPFDERGNFKLQ